MKSKILIGYVALLALSGAAQAADSYQIDPNHTYVQWHVNHFGFSNPTGKWLAKGTVEFNKENLQDSKVNVNIAVDEISTGIPQLDKHLKGEQFFDVKKFPTATFVSDKIEVSNNEITDIHGTLTVHGVSKPIVLKVKMNKTGINPINDQETIGFSGHADLKRSDFDMKTLNPGLGDDVKLEIELEASKPKNQ